jgi:hypothetical protein
MPGHALISDLAPFCRSLPMLRSNAPTRLPTSSRSWPRTRANQAACPSCGVPSGRTHSRYRRRLADVAVGGRRLVIALTARRLFCDQPAWQRRTFAEQVPGLTARYQRRTPGLTAMLEAIAIALVGRADARLTSALRATTSRSSLLRLLMALPDPPAATPRVLGVDDSRSSVARSTARC